MPDGTIIAIGGHEDRDGERVILRAVAAALGAGPLLILATASRRPHQYFVRYRNAFDGIGLHGVRSLPVDDAAEAHDPRLIDELGWAGGVFLTGGSQRRLVDAVRGTPVHDGLRALHARGGVIAGTSAGASALGSCMLSGTRELRLSDGLALIPDLMLDQHFAQRDRVGRLREAWSRRPECLAFGIDEDTAMVVSRGTAQVVGSGEVWAWTGSSFERHRAGGRLSLARR